MCCSSLTNLSVTSYHKMSHIELESWIAKTLILLKSPSEESVEELRNMLVETIHQKYNGRKQFKMIPPITGCENNERIKVGVMLL